jgi:O-antigen/teichoic acid export membrane protein
VSFVPRDGALAWGALGRLPGQAVSLVATLVVARILTPADFGVFALCSAPVALFRGLAVAAPAALAARGAGGARDDADGIAALQRVLAALGCVAMVVALGAVAWTSGEALVWPLGLTLAIGMFWPGCLAAVAQGRLERRLAFRALSAIESLAAVFGAAASLACALAGAGVWSLAAGSVCAAALHCALVVRAAGASGPVSRRPRLSAADARLAWHVALGTLAGQALDAAEALVVGRLLGAAGLGAWRTCRDLVDVPAAKTMASVNRIGLQVFLRHAGDAIQTRRCACLGLRPLAALYLPIYWGLAAVAPHGVPAVLGRHWAEAVPVAVALGAFMPLRLLHGWLGLVRLGAGDAAGANRGACMVGGGALFGLWLGAAFGLAGAACGMAMAGALGAAVSIELARRRLGLSWGDLGHGCAAALAGAGAMAVGVTALRLTVVGDRWSDADALALLVPTGAAIFAVVFAVADRGATLRALAALAERLGDGDAPSRLSAARGGDGPAG